MHGFIRSGLSVLIGTALIVNSTGVSFFPLDAADDTSGIVFYVSPDGDDSGSGSITSPFRTLEAARDAVRKYNGNMTGDITVYLRGGDYRITEPVVFDTKDSATNGFHINYVAYEGETPVINGAAKVTGWEKHNDKLWKAPLDRDYKLRNLYVNDRRANMGSVRLNSKGGYGQYHIEKGQADWAWDSGTKSDGIAYDANSVPRITSNFDDLEIINGTTWNENIVCTRDAKYENGSLILLLQQPYGAIAQTPGWGAGFSVEASHTIYNAYSFVDDPGEFFFDKTEKVLYYYPREGEDMTKADVEAPVADQLIVIEGKSTTDRVTGLSFSGITFANTDYQLTDVAGSHGKTTCQAAQTYTAFADSNWHKYKYEMADTLPAAVHIMNSDAISLTGNVVKHTGADGISMTNDVINSNVTGNYITDITSSGITVGHPQHIYIGDAAWDNHEKFPKGVEGICKNDVISQNMLYDISVVHGFGGCAAITAYYADTVKILSNTIEKTAYNGIHLGWGWCNFKDSETCRDNMICYNRVINSLNRLHDSGGIYTIGQMPGTVINENYIQGIPAAAQWQPTYGLHNDEGTAYIEENDNVLEISPDVTYTINCEEYGDKHHLTIKRTYATVKRMGKNPPYSDIDDPIVVSDNVWPFAQYKICLNSGVSGEYSGLVPTWLQSEADQVFPASCQTTGGSVLPIRKAGSGNTVWIAPDDTSSFKAGSSMTRATGTSETIKTPKEEGEYRIYVLDRNGKVLSKSKHLLRISGTGSSNVIEAEAYDFQSGIQTEDCSEGGSDVAYIEDGDYIGFKGIDFGTGTSKIDFRIGSNGAEASLEVRLGAPDGTLIGTLNVAGTGGWQKWGTQSCNITETSGKQDVYFIFKGGEGYLYNLNWWSPDVPGSSDDDIIYGDLTGDGVLNVYDLMLMRRAAQTGEVSDPEVADLDGDGVIGAKDVQLMNDFLLGRAKIFPVNAIGE